MSQDPAVRRFQAYFERVEQRTVLTMSRDVWNTIWPTSGSIVYLDVEKTPMAQVATSASLIASLAVEYAPQDTQIHLYRHDPDDDPTPVNLDKYAVWTDLNRHPAFPKIVIAASAQNSPELQAYIGNHVFIVKMDNGPDHWLSGIPGSALAFIKPA